MKSLATASELTDLGRDELTGAQIHETLCLHAPTYVQAHNIMCLHAPTYVPDPRNQPRKHIPVRPPRFGSQNRHLARTSSNAGALTRGCSQAERTSGLLRRLSKWNPACLGTSGALEGGRPCSAGGSGPWGAGADSTS